MIRLELDFQLDYRIDGDSADFVFLIHPARTQRQILVTESLAISQAVEPRVQTDADGINRTMQLRAQNGLLQVHYQATVDIDHHRADPDVIGEVPVHALPIDVIPFLRPSRYCQSDRLLTFTLDTFSHLTPGYRRVEAICQWVYEHVRFMRNRSDASTSAIETLISRAGICRDFSHLMIALCRALGIPARFVSGTDYGTDRSWGPPDFHAYVEAYLDGGWYIFDPGGMGIPMGFVRLASGRDAADVAFATIYGDVMAGVPLVEAHALPHPDGIGLYPHHCPSALSTDRSD